MIVIDVPGDDHDAEAEVARLEELGAGREQVQVQDWYVMPDPAGLLFCVVPVQPGSLDHHNARRWD
jgi:glyoxalase superfamily protein